jgi:DNA recombination protein RmuC
MTDLLSGTAEFLLGLLLGLAVWLRARFQQETIVSALQEQVTRLNAERQSQEERQRWADDTKEQMKDTFGALAGDVLKSNSQALTAETRKDVTGVVKPLEDKLKALDEQVRALEKVRAGAYENINTQLKSLSDTNSKLYDSTTSLASALKSPVVRGRWGELELRRVVEMAGMQKHVAFDEQTTTNDGGRPDLVVRLLGGGSLPIDSKVPMTAYLNAMETSDDQIRKQQLKAHAKAVKDRVTELGTKKYWDQFDKAPECVVMFVPNEASLGAAFVIDPKLFEYSIGKNVLICSPYTLVGFLRAVAVGWQQSALTENARQIADSGKELYERTAVFSKHLTKLAKSLGQSTETFNAVIASLETRMMPTVRKLKDLGDFDKEIELPEEINFVPRQPKQLGGGVNSGSEDGEGG